MVQISNLIHYNDKLLLIDRYYNVNIFKSVDAAKKYQKLIGCTHTLTKNGYYYFCTVIDEPEIISDDISNNQSKNDNKESK